MKKIIYLLGLVFLLGIIGVDGYCYQETANESNATDGDCGLIYTGKYAWDDSWTNPIYPPKLGLDRNYSSLTNSISNDGDPFDYELFWFNYTKPLGSTKNSLWQIKGHDTIFENLSLDNSCWEAYNDKLVLRFATQIVDSDRWQCYNTSHWVTLRKYGSLHYFYEEAMFWDFPPPPKKVRIKLWIDGVVNKFRLRLTREEVNFLKAWLKARVRR